MATTSDDAHFRVFASSLEKAIERCGEVESEEFLERQKRQVDSLISLEKDFKLALIAHVHGEKTYKAFIRFICEQRRNILDARPYFRERQHVFTQRISKALRNRSEKQLYRFSFNYRFVQFVLNSRKWRKGCSILRLATKIHEVRDELITMNMPLAISRANIFYRRTPKAHLTKMDFIQIACEGLMSGIDKFVPPFSKAFRSVAIGRMTGNFIEHYSETTLHFFPTDKRRIYRANKIVGRQPALMDHGIIADHVNKDVVDPAHHTTPSEIASLLAAASIVSADTPIAHDGEPGETVCLVDRFVAPDDNQPDVAYEKKDTMRSLNNAMESELNTIEQKVLRAKGVML